MDIAAWTGVICKLPISDGWVVHPLRYDEKKKAYRIYVDRRDGSTVVSSTAKTRELADAKLQKLYRAAAQPLPTPAPQRSMRQRPAGSCDPPVLKAPRTGNFVAGPGVGNKVSVKKKQVVDSVHKLRSALLRDIGNISEGSSTISELFTAVAAALRKHVNIQKATIDDEVAKVVNGILGRGGSHERTIRRHKAHVIAVIEGLTADDQIQVEIADGVHQHFDTEAGEKDAGTKADAEAIKANAVIVSGLKKFLAELRNRHRGRLPTAARIAKESVETAAAASVGRRQSGLVSRALGVSAERIKLGKRRWDEYEAGDDDYVYQPEEKSVGAYPDEFEEFVLKYWKKSTRRSEKRSDEVRNPHDRSDHKYKRVRFREDRVRDLFRWCCEDGVKHFELEKHAGRYAGVGFHLSAKTFRRIRPHYVRKAGRTTCMCRYHMQFAKFVLAYARFRQQLRRDQP